MDSDEDKPLRLVEAAPLLGMDVSTLRRCIRKGAPTAELGSVGRGRGSLVVVSDIRRWRAGQVAAPDNTDQPDQLKRLAGVFEDFFTRDSGGNGEPAHRRIKIPDREAAGYLIALYEYMAIRLTGTEPESLPEEIRHLYLILKQ